MSDPSVQPTVREDSSPVRPALSAPMPGWIGLFPQLLLGVFAIVLLARFATPGDFYLSYFEDDYYYYLIIAKNVVLHGMSSFDMIRPTNGYQPLWQLVNTGLYWIFGDHKAFFISLVALVFLMVCATYRTLSRTQVILGTANGYGLACALLSITFMAAISRTGMEVSLTLLLLTLFWKRMTTLPLEEQTPGGALLSGLLASGVVLGRIDALMVIALYCLITLYRPAGTRSAALRPLFFFFLGLFPVALYFIFNHRVFGTFLPISGVAKNLKSPFGPSASTLESLLYLRSVNVLLTWPSFALAFVFALRLFLDRNQAPANAHTVTPAARRVKLCILLHPLLFYTILSFTSDWPIWSWYLYPLVPIAALLGPTALSPWKSLRPQFVVQTITVFAGCISILTLIGMLRENPTERVLYQQAQEMQDFSQTHPGRYAMGGGAGVPGYVMTSTLVQLEGLMGDATFLQRIKNREPLLQALQELQVDYYVTMLLRGPPQHGPCYKLREPEMAGFQSPVMAGQFCTPLADFANPDGRHLLIFDVHRLAASSPDSSRAGR